MLSVSPELQARWREADLPEASAGWRRTASTRPVSTGGRASASRSRRALGWPEAQPVVLFVGFLLARQAARPAVPRVAPLVEPTASARDSCSSARRGPATTRSTRRSPAKSREAAALGGRRPGDVRRADQRGRTAASGPPTSSCCRRCARRIRWRCSKRWRAACRRSRRGCPAPPTS